MEGSIEAQAVYLVLCVIGTILPYLGFLPFFIENGLNVPLFIEESFPNDVGSGVSLDLMVSAVVLWVFVFTEGPRRGIRHLWLPVVATFAVGVSLALPLFLYMREAHLEKS